MVPSRDVLVEDKYTNTALCANNNNLRILVMPTICRVGSSRYFIKVLRNLKLRLSYNTLPRYRRWFGARGRGKNNKFAADGAERVIVFRFPRKFLLGQRRVRFS